jgi:hypothetical protein
MADSLITHAKRNYAGTITHLGNPAWGGTPWTVEQIRESINSGTNTFFTRTPSGKRAEVRPVGNHLQSTADGEPGNNLVNLPNFP